MVAPQNANVPARCASRMTTTPAVPQDGSDPTSHETGEVSAAEEVRTLLLGSKLSEPLRLLCQSRGCGLVVLLVFIFLGVAAILDRFLVATAMYSGTTDAQRPIQRVRSKHYPCHDSGPQAALPLCPPTAAQQQERLRARQREVKEKLLNELHIAQATCQPYLIKTSCNWTLQWNCPGQQPGSVGDAGDDGLEGYDCCCKQELWKDVIRPNTTTSTTLTTTEPPETTRTSGRHIGKSAKEEEPHIRMSERKQDKRVANHQDGVPVSGSRPTTAEPETNDAIKVQMQNYQNINSRIMRLGSSNQEKKQERSTGCHTAINGEPCHEAVIWAKRNGIHRHPSWYPGLDESSSLEEFQAALHYKGHGHCPLPCRPGRESTLAEHDSS